VSSVPGRYECNRDPRLAELLHHITEEGWGNDSVGDLDEDGFHASLLIVEPAERQELSDAFDVTRTVQYVHATIRKALNDAVRWGLQTRNPPCTLPYLGRVGRSW
jgi:hypothetical protein